MCKDILYKEENFVFSYRVGGVLIQNGKILLQKPVSQIREEESKTVDALFREVFRW